MGFMNNTKRLINKHSTKILAGTAIVAELVGFWFMHKEAPEAHKRLEALPEDANWLDKVKAAGPVYLPAIGMMVLSGGSVIGCCALGEVKLAAMTNIAMMSERALQQYEQKMIAEVGQDKAQELHKKAVKEVMFADSDYSGEIEITQYGRDIFYDPLCRRKFTSSVKHIEEAVVKFNDSITSGLDMWGSVNDWYDFVGIKHAKLAGYVGWHIDRKLAIAFNPHKTEDGEIITDIVYYSMPVLPDGREPKDIHY